MRNYKFYIGFIFLAVLDCCYIISICIYYFVEIVSSDSIKTERAIRLSWIPGIGVLMIILTLALFSAITGWALLILISGMIMVLLYDALVTGFESLKINPMSGVLLVECCALLKWCAPLAFENLKYLYMGVTCKEYVLIQRKRIKKDSSMNEDCCHRMLGNCPKSSIA